VNTGLWHLYLHRGIVKTLDRMRIYGYSYSDGGIYNTNDTCPWQLTTLRRSCSTWAIHGGGVYESLRYFAGKSAIYNYTDSGSKDAVLVCRNRHGPRPQQH